MTTESLWSDDSSLDSFPSLDSASTVSDADLLCHETLDPPPSDREMRLEKEVSQLRKDVNEIAIGLNAVHTRSYAKEKDFPEQKRSDISTRQSVILETLLQHIRFRPPPESDADIQDYRDMLIALAKS